MRKILKKVAYLTMLAGLGMNTAVAQYGSEVNKRLEFSFHLGLRNMPIGYLAEKQIMKLDDYMPMLYEPDNRYPGGALRGFHFNIGVKLKYNLRDAGGWAVIGTADRFYITNIAEVVGNETFIASTDNCGYINIPIMVGVNHTLYINEKLSIWAEAAIGLNHRSIEDRTIRVGTPEDNEEYLYKSAPAGMELKWQFYSFNSTYTYKETYDNALSVAFQIGSGIKLKKYRYSIGLYYYNLGWAPVKGSYSLQSVEYNSDSHSTQYETIVADRRFNHEILKTSMFVLRIGRHF